MNNCFVSVVIPAYNEETRIGPTLENIASYLGSRSLLFEVLVIDDGSEDRTAEITETFATRGDPECPVRLYRNDRNRGKGHSVRAGMLASKGKYALLTDADLSSPIEEMPKLERAVIEGNFDLALGSRGVEGSLVEIHQPWIREIGGKAFNQLMRLVTGLPYLDTQCGFKLLKMSCCRDLFERQTIEDFGFDVEILYLAKKMGLRAKEVPVVWRHREGSKVRLGRDALSTIRGLFRIRWNDWRGHYKSDTSD